VPLQLVTEIGWLIGVSGEDLPLGFDLAEHPRRAVTFDMQVSRIRDAGTRLLGKLSIGWRHLLCSLGYRLIFAEPGGQERHRITGHDAAA
jgi:hypothetical protein